MNSEEIRFIREEIRRQVQIVLSGVTDGTSTHSEGISELYPSMPTIEGRPIMQPFGVSSQAPDGTIQVTARQGEHKGNWLVLGHRDKGKPGVSKGETKLYNSFGDIIYVSQGVIRSTTPKWIEEADDVRIGSEAASEPFVLGNIFKQFMSDVLQEIAIHTHISGLPGYPTTAPQDAAAFTNFKATPIDDGAILSDKIYGEKG